MMDDFLQEVFLMEIVIQSRFALHAHDKLAEVPKYDIPGAFYQIQAFLAATANIANVLFPNPRVRKSEPDFVMRCERRGQHLVDLLAVQGLRVLDNRDVRNDYLHADERVQDWVEANIDRRLRDYALIQDTPPGSTEGHLHWYAKKTNEAGFGDLNTSDNSVVLFSKSTSSSPVESTRTTSRCLSQPEHVALHSGEGCSQEKSCD